MKDSTNFRKVSPVSILTKVNYKNTKDALNVEEHQQTLAIYSASDDFEGIHASSEDCISLFHNIKGFLIIGKIIGVLPFSGVFGSAWKEFTFRKNSVSTIISIGITTIVVFNAVLDFIHFLGASKRNALEIAESIRSTLYFTWGCQIYIYFLCRGNKFVRIFQIWNYNQLVYSRKDKTLRRDTLLITGVIMTSAILENLVLHMEYFKSFDNISGRNFHDNHYNVSFLATYYYRAHHHWAVTLGYNWFFAVLAFVQHKWTLYAWNYMDVTIAVFARAMYFRFKALGEEAEKKLVKTEESSINKLRRGICNDSRAWLQVVQDHQNLCRVLESMEDFFSPVVFGTFAVNIFYISLQLLDGLTNEVSNRSIVNSIYAPWAFLHLVMRTFILSICCARINVYAHKIQKIFLECPIEQYTTEVYRLDKRVTTGPNIGLTGLGCFTVTKPFILSIISVVFTIEIVLLQSSPNTSDISSNNLLLQNH